MESFDKKKIADIVDNNYINASVLYYFGISFFDYSEETLEQACRDKGLDIEVVVKKLENHPNSDSRDIQSLQEYPIDLIIEYLKHAHYLFIKQRLPYLARLIDTFDIPEGQKHIGKDLKFVFPLFVEDFIHHIYEEEDTLFSYISNLNAFMKGVGNPSSIYYQMEKNSLKNFAMEHEEHDDEMRGIRNITNDYQITPSTPLSMKVIYAELQSLEKELQTHARIENEILFPKALILEKEAMARFKKNINLN